MSMNLKGTFSPEYGQRLLPVLIDEIALSDPNRTYLSIAKTLDPKDGFEDVSFATFARAIDRCAHWIKSCLGRGSNFQPLFAMLGPHDPRSAVLVLACVKTGHCMFFSSPGNNLDTHVALLDKLECKVVFKPDHCTPVLDEILKRRPMTILSLPSLEHLFRVDPVPPLPYSKTFQEAQYDPIVILHSSGTTGTPKLLHIKLGSFATHDAYQLLPALGVGQHTLSAWQGKRVFCSFPYFHAAGLPTLMDGPPFFGVIPVIVPRAEILTTDLAESCIRHGNVQAAYAASSILVELSRRPGALALLAELDSLSFAGAPLPPDIATELNKQALLMPIFGSTECLHLPTLVPPREMPLNGLYYNFAPQLGHEFRPFGGAVSCLEDGDLYEFVIVASAQCRPYQTCFYTCPELLAPDEGEFHMKDLYIRHPDPRYKDWWRSVGRTDDVLALSDGKKFNPIMMEDTIAACPHVSAALVVGHGKDHVVLLVEPVLERQCDGKADEQKFVDDIWPTVIKAVEAAPKGGAVRKKWIIVTPCGSTEGMARVGGKNTVLRKATALRFKVATERLYDNEK